MSKTLCNNADLPPPPQKQLGLQILPIIIGQYTPDYFQKNSDLIEFRTLWGFLSIKKVC